MATTNTKPSRQASTHRLYRVTGNGKQSNWTPIGAAWMHRDGKGFSIACDAVPLQGRIVMRLATKRTSNKGGEQ